MKSAVSFISVAILAAAAWGQDAVPPQVHVSEVLRRGDLVTDMGDGPRSGAIEAFVAAMKPPADDSHLWHVSVWTTPGCQACEKVKADFRKSPELLAFVAAPAPALPWAHYVEYSGADETQKDRREKYKVSRYPTIVVQPPRNGMWGDPGLVVFYDNSGYSTPAALAAKITKAVRRFAEVQHHKGFPKLPVHEVSAHEVSAAGGATQFGVNPPVPAPPQVDPFNPSPPSQPAPAQWPPETSPSSNLGPALLQVLSLIGGLFGMVLPSGTTMAALLLAIQTGLWIWEIRAKKTAATWDDKTIAVVRSIVKEVQNPSPTPGPTPPATP